MNNKLTLLSQFKEVLSNYQLSDKSLIILKNAKLILLAAPTAAGRNTIINELIKSKKYHYIVSDTTRNPRINDGIKEQNGINYWFKDEKEFLNGLKNGNYLEAAIIHEQQVSGISVSELQKAVNQKANAVTDIDVQGVDAILKVKPDAVSLFILPPSIEIWMDRLHKRGKLEKEELLRRLKSAIKEFEFALKSEEFLFIVNNEFHKTVKLINKLMETHLYDMDYQNAGKELTKRLLTDTKKLVSTLDL